MNYEYTKRLLKQGHQSTVAYSHGQAHQVNRLRALNKAETRDWPSKFKLGSRVRMFIGNGISYNVRGEAVRNYKEVLGNVMNMRWMSNQCRGDEPVYIVLVDGEMANREFKINQLYAADKGTIAEQHAKAEAIAKEEKKEIEKLKSRTMDGTTPLNDVPIDDNWVEQQ